MPVFFVLSFSASRVNRAYAAQPMHDRRESLLEVTI